MKIPIRLLLFSWLMFGAYYTTTPTSQPTLPPTIQTTNETPTPLSSTALNYEDYSLEDLGVD